MSLDEDELRQLLVGALDGDASESQLARLNELLRSSERLRLSAARFLRDDSILTEEIGAIEEAIAFVRQSSDSPSTASRAREPMQPPRQSPSTPPAWKGLRSTLRVVNSHGLAIAAASLLMLVGAGWQYMKMVAKFDRLYALAAVPDEVQHERLKKGARQAALAPRTSTVARVTGLVNCQWASGDPGLKFGDQLAPGQRVRMSRGLVQLTFDTGAKIMVEGPADFIAQAPTEARLSHGRIAAAVPRFARGYTIVTPTAEVVDLGTEFGVAVDDSGASEVHVFDGDVVARSRGAGVTKSKLIHAREDEGVQFDATSRGARLIAADREKFVRRLTPALPPDKLPPLPITDHLALWLAADVMPALKEGDRVSTWPDILIGDNRFPDDAWQFDERLCPLWVRDAEGRPAVRFDGWSTYMITSPMATGDNQTVFVVFSTTPASFASESHGGMLLKYGLDAPSLELTVLPDHSPRGLVWASQDDGSTSNVAVLKGRPVAPHAPHSVVYSYDVAGERAELILDGKSQGVATAPRRIEQHAKKYIGSHAQPWFEAYFLGSIYEIIVYDTALDAENRERVNQYLSTRYGFASED